MMYKCLFCNSPTNTFHEIWYGIANRKICLKYGLKVPLCYNHHTGNEGVHKHKHKGQQRIFIKLGLPDYTLITARQIMNKSEKKWNKVEKTFIILLGETIQERIK